MNNEEKIIELLTEIRDSLKKPEKKAVKKFVKPLHPEIVLYCHEKNYDVDATAFMNFYDSNGWKVGRNPMKSWKAALTTWHKRSGANNENNQRNNQASRKPSLAERLQKKQGNRRTTD